MFGVSSDTCVPMQGGSLYHIYDGLWYDPAGRQTHDLLGERRSRLPLSQPMLEYVMMTSGPSSWPHKKGSNVLYVYMYLIIEPNSNIRDRVWITQWLVRPPLNSKVVDSSFGHVIPKTIIKMIQTTSLLGTQVLG